MKSGIRNLCSIWVIFATTLTTISQAQAADYFVDQNHPNANDSNIGTISLPWKTITKANSTLVAGDTVYIKAGSYTSYIAPVNSGTAVNRITYTNFGTDTVTVRDAAYGVLLDGKSYITVQGINFTNLDRFMYLQNGANRNIIAYSKFDSGRSNHWTGSIIYRNSSYNWIHHSQFSNYGACLAGNGSGSDQGTTLDIGDEESGTDLSERNVVEYSTFFHAGHHVLGVFSRYNTIRNNYLHNEAWSNGHGHRTMYLQGYAVSSGFTLFEGNRFGYSSDPCPTSNETTHGVLMTTSDNIFRYNNIFHTLADGLGLYSYVGQGSFYSKGSRNAIYNNTIFNSGLNIPAGYAGGSEDTAIWFESSTPTGNLVKNNLYFKNFQVHSGYTSGQVFANNWNGNTQGDPLFVNASATPPADKTDATLPNLNLQAASPAIDRGGALTTITSATGSGTSVNLANASYFQDGTYGPPGVIQADWIAIGSVGNVAQIASITGNTVTLASSMSWINGAPVWLYKKSDGVIVLYGAAPDAGAFEFSGGSVLPAPTNLRVLP